MKLKTDELQQKFQKKVEGKYHENLGDKMEIIVEMDRITVRARDSKQQQFGLQRLSQLPFLEKGVYELFPLQSERGVMIDIGRKFYSIEALKALIDYMAQLNMTHLQVHFSENEGFGLACDSFPELAAAEHLTKTEMKELIAYGKHQGIQLFPAFDSPGHLYQLLRLFPEWQVLRTGEDSPIFPANRALDIANPKAVAAVKTIIQEYLELFDESDYFHLGADEYIVLEELERYPTLIQLSQERYGDAARAYEVIIEYINELNRLIQKHGKISRIWSDGVYRKDLTCEIPLDPAIEITYWTNYHPAMADVSTFIEKGHNVLNFNDNYFYFVLGEAASYSYPTKEKIAKDWEITLFSGGQHLSSEEMHQVVGTYFAIWADVPKALSEEEVLQMIVEPLAAQQAKLWHFQKK